MSYFEEIGLWPNGENLRHSYVVGLLLSLALTGAVYLLVTQHLIAGTFAIALLIALAFLQAIAQLVFFLHLGREGSSKARLTLLFIALLIIAILVAGSLWVMSNLNSRMMPSQQQMEEYMNRQPGI